MMIYLLKSSACLVSFLVFYIVFLEREKMHQFNRFYLMGSLIISLIAPLLLFETVIYIEETAIELPLTTEIETASTEVNYGTMMWNGFLYIWFSISILLLLRFSKNLFNIYRKIKINQKETIQNATLVLVDKNISPHTFLKYIFINKKDYEQGNIEQELLTHELTHVTEKHTIDVITIELLTIMFWFNPLLYWLKRAIQLNHEFIADSKVIHQHKNISEYQHLLLNKATWNNNYYLASNLNYLLTKKRLIMMRKESSKVKTWLKQLTVFPLVMFSVYAFSDHVETYKPLEKDFINETQKDTLRATLANGEEIKIWEVEEKNNALTVYKKLNKQYITLKNKKPHYVKSKLKRQQGLDAMFSELGSMYFRLSKEDKKKVNRPVHPHHPYIRLKKGNKVYYKLSKELTKEDKLLLPPPPPKQRTNKYQKMDSIPQKSKHLVVNKKDKTFSYENKEGKIITKKFSDLTEKEKQMMPPPPPLQLKQIKKKKQSKSKWKVEDKIKLVEVNNVSSSIQKEGKTRTFYFENKKISKKQFYKLIKNNKSYVIGSANKNNIEEMYLARTQKKLLELISK